MFHIVDISIYLERVVAMLADRLVSAKLEEQQLSEDNILASFW